MNDVWAMDFIHDQLANGRKVQLLMVIDVYTSEALAIEVGHRLRGEDVARILNRLVHLPVFPRACLRTMVRGLPVSLSASGPMRTGFGRISLALEPRPTTPTSSRSMDCSEASV